MIDQVLWNKVLDFHGHACGGLTIGFQAAVYAKKLLELDFSQDEQVVCVAENDACGIDAIQVLLGCSVGKGNLMFRLRGKQAYSFFNRKTGKSVRLVLHPLKEGLDKADAYTYYQSHQPEELFDVKETTVVLPEKARIFHAFTCDCCGENTAESFLHLENGQKLCQDCYHPYHRFDL